MIEDLEAYLANPDWYNTIFKELGIDIPKLNKVKKVLSEIDG